MRYYAGFGRRNAPPQVCYVLTCIAQYLESRNWILRSGGARGCDTAFEAGAYSKEIFTPWRTSEQAVEMASRYHPGWSYCSDFSRRLLGRNCQILLGQNLDSPVDFGIYWMLGSGGGTQHTLTVAAHQEIPVVNIFDVMQNYREVSYDRALNYIHQKLGHLLNKE